MSPRTWIFVAVFAAGLPLGFALGRRAASDVGSNSALATKGEGASREEMPSARPAIASARPARGANPVETVEERLAKISAGKGIGDYHARCEALSPIFLEWGRSDPEAAFAAWANTPEVAGMGMCAHIIANLVKADGVEATLARAHELEDPRARREARRSIGSHIYMVSDRARAAGILLDSVAEDERAEVMSTAIGSWRMKDDIDEVWAWVESKADRFTEVRWQSCNGQP